jgi:hypothetical protein
MSGMHACSPALSNYSSRAKDSVVGDVGLQPIAISTSQNALRTAYFRADSVHPSTCTVRPKDGGVGAAAVQLGSLSTYTVRAEDIGVSGLPP